MNGTMNTGEPPYNGGIIARGLTFGLGFYAVTLLLIFILYLTAYIFKVSLHSRLPPQFTTTDTDHHYISITQGLRNDILATFPTVLYSELAMRIEAGKDVQCMNSYGSGCTICLAEYKPMDVLRLLPECGHLFHVTCIDTWLKVHPTCPVCRNSFDSTNES